MTDIQPKPPDPGKIKPIIIKNVASGRPDRTVANWERDYYRYLAVKQKLNTFTKKKGFFTNYQTMCKQS